jgi:hypothetical protein
MVAAGGGKEKLFFTFMVGGTTPQKLKQFINNGVFSANSVIRRHRLRCSALSSAGQIRVI